MYCKCFFSHRRKRWLIIQRISSKQGRKFVMYLTSTSKEDKEYGVSHCEYYKTYSAGFKAV